MSWKDATAALGAVLALAACDTGVTAPESDTDAPQPHVLHPPITFTVAGGLTSPRGLAFGPDGNLYVAEAGVGGDHSTDGTCQQVPPPVGPYTGGFTARISRITPDGQRFTVVDGLPSAADGLGGTIGIAGVAFLGGKLFALIAGGGCSHGNPGIPTGVIRVAGDGSWDLVADFGAFYGANPVAVPDPADFEPDGQLFSMVSVTDKRQRSLVFVEANGGALYRLRPSGGLHRVADLSPLRDGFSTPTVVTTHRGRVFVGNFGRFTLDGSEKVVRLDGHGAPVEVATGLNAITGIAFDRKNRMYVLEMAHEIGFFPGSGRVVRVNPDGTHVIVASDLLFPTGMVLGPDGALYVSNKGLGFPAGAGEVVRIELP